LPVLRCHRAIVVPALVAAGLGGCLAEDDAELPATAEPAGGQLASGGGAIVNGTLVETYPTTGMLALGATPDESHLQCSGTLIGCSTFITAAHCVCGGNGSDCQGRTPATPSWVFLQNAGFVAVSSIAVHPGYDRAILAHDLAVIQLAEPVSGIRPTPLATERMAVGRGLTLVGYGRVGPEALEYGLKREAPATFVDCGAGWDAGALCFADSQSTTCNGDSGSGYLVEGADGLELAGIHSGGTCVPGQSGVGNRIADHADFIASVAGASLGEEACGSLPSVGQEEVVVHSLRGALDASEIAEYPIEVAPGTAELRVALNSSDLIGPGKDLDLELELVTASDPSLIDVDYSPGCEALGSGPYGACRLRSPPAGTWRARVASKVGRGDYQLVTTTFAGPLAVDDHFLAESTRPLAIDAAAGLLANDLARLGPFSSVEVIVPPAHGEVTIEPDGSFVYTATASGAATDAFTYRASDGTYTTSAVVTIDLDSAGLVGGCATGGDEPGGRFAALALVAAAVLAGGACRRRRPARHPARPRR
jgi:V8-like Glu-specific endopeptidase